MTVTMQRRAFLKDVVIGAAAVSAGGVLAGPREARACSGGAYDEDVPLGAPIAIGELASLKITCLSEVGWWSNARFQADVAAGGGSATSQWLINWDKRNSGGYSALIEATELDGTTHLVLLDTGWNQAYMRWVFEREGVAELLENGIVERAIISHEHLDHFWGLPALCKLARRLPLFVPSTFSERAWDFIDESKHRGHVMQGAPTALHKHFPGFATGLLDVPITLGIRGEQILYFNVKDRGLVIVSGCCHPGPKAAIDFAAANVFTATGRFYGLFGGLHLSPLETWSTAGDRQIDAIQAAQFERIASNHCTGVIGVQKMLERNLPVATGSGLYGTRSTLYVGCGDSITF